LIVEEQLRLLSNAVWRLKLSWIWRRIKGRSLRKLQWSERERESCCLSTWKGMVVGLKQLTVEREKKRYKCSLLPTVSEAVAVPRLNYGSAALQQCLAVGSRWRTRGG
jgi:hypothetical protein